MTKAIHKSKRKAVEAVSGKARARRSAYVMKPEYLAEIERFRLMDDDQSKRGRYGENTW